MYEDIEDMDIPQRNSSLIPILMIVAGVLAVAVGVAVVLFAFGFFAREPSPTVASAPEPAPAAVVSEALPEPAPQISTIPETNVPRAQVAVAPPAAGEPPVRSTHGDWQVRCDTPPGAQNEQCVLMQFVTAEDRENVGLTVIVLKTADRQARIMRVLAPLGVLLTSGLGLKIDETDLGRAGFVRCLPNGCVAEVIIEDGLLQQLGGGTTATFVIFQTPEEGIGIPISLDGFVEGFEALP